MRDARRPTAADSCSSVLRFPWPFLAVVDGSGDSTGWCALRGPLRPAADRHLYNYLRHSFRFVGFTSYLTFPMVDEGTLSDYSGLCEGWWHCFRQPDRYITARYPTELISESDFTDPRAVRQRGEQPKEFDFVYVCLPGATKERWKNWELAKRCLHTLCCEMDLTGLLLG